MKIFGIVLIVLGIIMTAVTGFNIVSRKKVVDLGSVEISKEENTPVYWSPMTGGIMILAGAIVVLMGRKNGAGKF